MDRITILQISKSYYLYKNISVETIFNLIYEYCVEMGKTLYIQQFIKAITSTLSYMSYFEYALQYYERKYTIVKLYNKNILLNIF